MNFLYLKFLKIGTTFGAAIVTHVSVPVAIGISGSIVLVITLITVQLFLDWNQPQLIPN